MVKMRLIMGFNFNLLNSTSKNECLPKMNVFKIKIDHVQFRAIYGKHAGGRYFKTTEEVNRRVVGQISKMDF